jgi:6-phosphogluconolactonase
MPPLGAPPVVFVGGFGDAPVIQYDLSPTNGALTQRAMFDAGPEPTCFAVDPARRHLFVGNEADSEQGGITSYALNADGSASFVNHRAASDSGFTSLSVHPSGKFIAGASYGGGSASVFPIAADGSVGAQAGTADFGSDAMSHCVAYDPGGQHLLVATKGTDSVQQLLQSQAGMLTPNAPPEVPAAAGPRHLAVHPNGKLVFVVSENGSALTSYQLSSEGKLTEVAEISSLPADYEGDNTGAHVELSANGHILYVSNRGHDSIGVFTVDAASGTLALLEFEPARGDSPHDFDIDQTGRILIAANRRSSTLTVFAIAADGSLSPLGQPVPTREDPTGVLIHYPQ